MRNLALELFRWKEAQAVFDAQFTNIIDVEYAISIQGIWGRNTQRSTTIVYVSENSLLLFCCFVQNGPHLLEQRLGTCDATLLA